MNKIDSTLRGLKTDDGKPYIVPASARAAASKSYAPPVHVTPYLPKEAEQAIKNHERYNKQPAFVLAFQSVPYPGACPNCSGMGQVYVRFCDAGPYNSSRLTKSAVTYFDGNEIFGKGWYSIKETKGWICPECHGNG